MPLENDLLLRTARGERTERPPIWIMRQAGRILPQYRAIRGSVKNFIALITDPQLAAEVTIQPVDELGVDAAILFSDILVIPEAMGCHYELIEKKGPVFPDPLRLEGVDQLISGEKAACQIDYVYAAIDQTLKLLNGRVPLIGFSGAPWTLMAYMIEGQGSKTFSKAKAFLYRHPSKSHQLLQKITDTIIAYLKKKVEHGVHLVQLFDSWAGLLDRRLYREFCIPYIRQIADALTGTPFIVFAKGAWFAMDDLNLVDDIILGVDWTMPAEWARNQVGKDRVLQGNLDPCHLYAGAESIRISTRKMIDSFGQRHIVNLGHGVYPDTPLENVKHFVNFVKDFSYQV